MTEPPVSPPLDAARLQLEAEAYSLVPPPLKDRAPALAYSANDTVQDAARGLQGAVDAIVTYRAAHGADGKPVDPTPVLEALRHISRLRRVCAEVEEEVSRALILLGCAAPALAHYRDMPTYSLNEWAADVWRLEGRSMYERDDE